jgi:hypothetical protein
MMPWGLAVRTAGDLSNRNDVDDATTASNTELHRARGECEECVIATPANVIAWMEMRAALAHDDFTSVHQLAAKSLDTESLRI